MSDPPEGYKPDDLLSVPELAKALGMPQTRVWLFAKRHELPRYRTEQRGKTTLFRFEDAWRAYTAPIPKPAPARARDRDAGKVAA